MTNFYYSPLTTHWLTHSLTTNYLLATHGPAPRIHRVPTAPVRQVHSLKEQMSLMQGQLVTAQQQQGTLHKKVGRHH